MKNIKKIFILTAWVTLFYGCENILEPEPQGQIALEALFSTEKNAITAINGVYAPLRGLYNSTMLRLTDLASDDGWTPRNELEPDIYVVEQNFSHSRNAWSSHYTGLTRANTVIDGMPNVPVWSSDELRDAVEGQAKFMRAFYYFNLVRLFGGVPLVTSEIKSTDEAAVPRATVEEVYNQIKSDLTEAISLLPAAYEGGLGIEAGRPTRYAAHALKASVHLELEEWSEAANAATAVIGNGSLLANYADNFNGTNENGAGSILEVQYAGPGGGVTARQSLLYAPEEFQGFILTLPTNDDLNGAGGGASSGDGLIQAFEAGDLRRDVIVATYDLANVVDPSQPDGSLYYINKYFNTGDPVGESSWNFPLIRYAEALLIAAEALNEVSYVADGEALQHLNEVRSNAGLGTLTSVDLPDQASFRTAVRQERRIELAFETKRYFDLNRWGILASQIQPQLTFLGLNFPLAKTSSHPVTGKDYYLYPIPDVEFINNADLGDQNPGYN